MRVLVAGTGSIGRRHIRNLREIVGSLDFVLLRADGREDELSRELGARVVQSYREALTASPDLAIIANPSILHADALEALLPEGIPCYVEKPVVANEEQLQRIEALISRLRTLPPTLVGCNLRFLPSLTRLREMLKSSVIGRPVQANLQVGQWLADWRPAQDYRRGYSADPDRGGGVVLDLIHELDAVLWLFGDFDQVYGVGGHYSRLEIRSEDTSSIILGRSGGPAVNVGLNYVSRRPIRHYEIIGDEGTLVWDLPTRKLELVRDKTAEPLTCDATDFDVQLTYVTAMKEMLAAIAEGRSTAQDIGEGMRSAALAVTINHQLRNP